MTGRSLLTLTQVDGCAVRNVVERLIAKTQTRI